MIEFGNPTHESDPLLDRHYLDIVGDEEPMNLIGFRGIQLIHAPWERPDNETCYQYVFGKENADEAIERLVKTGIRTGHERGSIAFYFDETNYLVHVGFVAADGKIISKWGDGPVFKHDPHMVPLSYGTIGGYYKDPLNITS